MKFKNKEAKLIYQDIKTRYNKATINKHELAKELSLGEGSIDRYIGLGYGIPPYMRIGDQTKANASQRWAIVDVAEYLAGRKVKMDGVPDLKQGMDMQEVDKAINNFKGGNMKTEYNYHPKSTRELKDIVENLIEKRGLKANLNDIDTSKITDMRELFLHSNFNGDISNWDTSKAKNMFGMFEKSVFNQDISKWNVSKVENMSRMFCYSKFNKDISNWNVSNVKNMKLMFYSSKFNKDISNWDTSSVTDMFGMFKKSPLEENIKKRIKNV